MGLHDYITGILQWNNPSEGTPAFSLELDTILNTIVYNIVKSNCEGQENYGNLLIDGGCQWILDRFATRMVH